MIGIIDYKGGNLFSVQKALDFLAIKNFIISSSKDFLKAERLIFPGVGTAKITMEVVREKSLDQALKGAFAEGVPILGICIGCQAFLSFSEEDGGVPMLSFVEGTSKKFSKSLGKVPHMGWNQISIKKSHVLLDGIIDLENFYFVHSYYPLLDDENLITTKTEHARQEFVSSYAYKNLFATQFHLEKSGTSGLKILKNFSNWKGGEHA